MASIINASTSSGLVTTADTSGILQLQSNGTTIATISSTGLTQNVNPAPAFSAYLNGASMTLSTSTTTKVLFNAENFDTNNCYDTSTYRFTPTVAGYYQLGFVGQCDYMASGRAMVWLYKSGSQILFQEQNLISGASTYPSMTLNGIAYANGTTDYFEIYVRQESGGNKTLYASGIPCTTYFNGSLIRAA